MKPTKNNTIRERFEKRFVKKQYRNETGVTMKHLWIGVAGKAPNPDEVWQFIEQELEAQEDRIVKELHDIAGVQIEEAVREFAEDYVGKIHGDERTKFVEYAEQHLSNLSGKNE